MLSFGQQMPLFEQHAEGIMGRQWTRIEIDKEHLKFSAAHFTIFSARERERLHGHNFSVYVAVTVPVGDNGMCFSYREIKERIARLCEQLDEYTLIAADSPHLHIRTEGDYYHIDFADETLILLRSDTLLLPLRNTTVEEFARYLLEGLRSEEDFFSANEVRALTVKVSSGPGQSGSCDWQAEQQN